MAENPFVLHWLLLASAEDEGRTEQPSEIKKRREREKGRFAKSQEIPSSLITVSSCILLFFASSWMLTFIQKNLKLFLGNFSSLPTFSVDNMIFLIKNIVIEFIIVLAPIFIVVFIAGIIGNVVQVGFFFSLKPLKFDFTKINFTFNNLLKRVLFSRQVFVNLAKNLAKILVLVFAAYYIIQLDFLSIMKTGDVTLKQAVRILSTISLKLSIVLALILLLFSIPDYFYQKYEFIQSIKMTKEEVKREFKETEMEPLLKQRQKQKAQENYRRNVVSQVKQADVIITNPSHLAIAIKYEPEKYSSPYVLAKGKDRFALVIRNLAKRNEIPIIENRPLARELYDLVEEGQEIPTRFFQILVDILLNIDSFREKFVNAG